MKKCHKCDQEKPADQFPVNRSRKDGRSETCLSCKREYNRQHYQNNKRYYVDKAQKAKERLRLFFQAYKSRLKCKCGQVHPAALHFHHNDPSKKEFVIADAVGRSWSMKRLLAEVEKCTVMCGNCHAILHWEEKHGKWPPECAGCTQPSEG